MPVVQSARVFISLVDSTLVPPRHRILESVRFGRFTEPLHQLHVTCSKNIVVKCVSDLDPLEKSFFHPRRPWCAVEVATAVRNKIDIVMDAGIERASGFNVCIRVLQESELQNIHIRVLQRLYSSGVFGCKSMVSPPKP